MKKDEEIKKKKKRREKKKKNKLLPVRYGWNGDLGCGAVRVECGVGVVVDGSVLVYFSSILSSSHISYFYYLYLVPSVVTMLKLTSLYYNPYLVLQ